MKKLVLICAPVTSRSGYGAHARDLVTSLLEHDKYDIKIQDVPWGNCPRHALNVDNIKDKSTKAMKKNLNLTFRPYMVLKLNTLAAR